MNHIRPFVTVVIYVAGTLFLCSAAIYNRFPLVYSDSGAYLRDFIEWHYSDEHPIFYSIFIGFLHWRLNLWLIVVGQSLLAVLVIERTLTHLLPRAGAIAKLGVLAMLAVATSLPWFTGMIMADMLAPVMVLALYLVVVLRDRLEKEEYYAFLFVLCIAQAAHYTHISIAVGLLACLAVAAVIFKTPKLRNVVPVGLTSALAISAIVAVNFAARQEIAFTRYGSISLLSRLIGYGTVQDYLKRHCSSEHYDICRYLDEINHQTRGTEWLWWDDGSILPKLGGGDGYRAEAGRLARAVIFDAPGKHFGLMSRATIDQFFNFATGIELGRLGEGMQIYRMVTTYFPSEAHAYRHSRQYVGELNLDLVNRIDVPVAYASLFALILFLSVGVLKRDAEFTIFCSVILLALLGNAFLCGALSTGDARYQSRVISLAPLAAAVGILRIRSVRESNERNAVSDKAGDNQR